jgi:hypothetical protein
MVRSRFRELRILVHVPRFTAPRFLPFALALPQFLALGKVVGHSVVGDQP